MKLYSTINLKKILIMKYYYTFVFIWLNFKKSYYSKNEMCNYFGTDRR